LLHINRVKLEKYRNSLTLKINDLHVLKCLGNHTYSADH